MTRSFRSTLTLMLTLLVILAAPASAERKRDRLRDVLPHDYAPGTSQEARISMEEAIERVQRQSGGKVLDARDHGDTYRLKVLRDGEIRIYHVDARSGHIR